VSSQASNIAQALDEARTHLARVEPAELAQCVEQDALIVDIRPQSNREAEGEMPGAIVIERNVLEWRLDPTSPDRLDRDFNSQSQIVLFCNDGYASSLAARILQQLGLVHATDLVGGFRAWHRWRESPSKTTGTPSDQSDDPNTGNSTGLI